MRKLLVMLVVTVLASSFAFAANQSPDGVPTADDKMMDDDMRNETMPEDMPEDGVRDDGPDSVQDRMNGSGPLVERDGQVVHRGLDQALSQVENEQARQALQRNMDRFLERHQERLTRAENVTVDVDQDGSATVRAREKVRYLGFIPGKATTRFEMGRGGGVDEKPPWYRFLYSEADRSEGSGDADEAAT